MKRKQKAKSVKFYDYSVTFSKADKDKPVVDFRITTWIKPEHDIDNADGVVKSIEKEMDKLVKRMIQESEMFEQKKIVILEVSPMMIRQGRTTFFSLQVFLTQKENIRFEKAYDETIPHLFRFCDGISKVFRGTFTTNVSRFEKPKLEEGEHMDRHMAESEHKDEHMSNRLEKLISKLEKRRERKQERIQEQGRKRKEKKELMMVMNDLIPNGYKMKVESLDDSGNVNRYSSIIQAALKTRISPQSIKRAAFKIQNVAGGLRWRVV